MTPIRWTSSPWGFRRTPFEDHCRWLSEHGLRYVCEQFNAQEPGTFRPGISKEDALAAIATSKGHGLQFASFNADGDFTVYDDLDKQIALCCAQIDQAAIFAPEIIILFAGWQDRDDAEVYRQVGSALKTVARHAAGAGLTLAMENHGGVTRTVEQCNRILDEVNEPNVGLNYDPANFLMYGQDPLDALERLEHPITFTHLKSLKHTEEGKQYCRVSEGVIDYEPILARLLKTYDGFYALEYEETSDVMAGSEDDLDSLCEVIRRITGQAPI